MLKFEKEQMLKERESLALAIQKLTGDKDEALKRLILVSAKLESDEDMVKSLTLQVQQLSQALQAKDK
jgi:hypothetical protein